jgi:hypothetical protein
MDGEDTRQLLAQARLRCLQLEADRDAESLRVDRYRKILDNLTCEDGVTQPQGAGILHMPRRTLVCPRVATFVVA